MLGALNPQTEKEEIYLQLAELRGGGIKTGGGRFFSLDHVEEVHHGNGLYVDEALTGAMERKEGIIVNPIYYWTDSEIWQYIRKYDVSVNPLYFPPYNYKRVGCLLCPMATYSEKMKQCVDFPGYKKLCIRAFDNMLKVREETGLRNREGWETGEDVFNWWAQEYKHNVKGQITIEEWLGSVNGKA